MDFLTHLGMGFGVAFTPFNVMMAVAGVLVGILIGYLGKHRWWVTLGVALAAAFFNWLVFVHWLHVPFPEGKLWIF